MITITYEDFEKVDVRTGTVVKTEPFLRAKKPAYKVWVDFGHEIGILQTSAQITVHYMPEELIGQKVIGCVNLGEKNIAGFSSQFLLLGFSDQNGDICLVSVDSRISNGKKMH